MKHLTAILIILMGLFSMGDAINDITHAEMGGEEEIICEVQRH